MSGFRRRRRSGGLAIGADAVVRGEAPALMFAKTPYERIVAEIIDGLAAARPLDGIYLDLHGAMVAEHVDDGEGELLARLRRAVGDAIPVVISLDLHANVTPLMMAHADALIAYPTYPHIDMADTGRVAQRHMARLLISAGASQKRLRKLPFLIPVSWQCTTDEPVHSAFTRNSFNWKVPRSRLCHSPPAFPPRLSRLRTRWYGLWRDPGRRRRRCGCDANLVLASENAFDGRIFSADEGSRAPSKSRFRMKPW